MVYFILSIKSRQKRQTRQTRDTQTEKRGGMRNRPFFCDVLKGEDCCEGNESLDEVLPSVRLGYDALLALDKEAGVAI